jgi:glutamate formiminotransferase/formiminotetrahydrofolate cyclodeaminase
VGALAARAAVLGAALNVKINASALSDKAAAKNFIEQADALAAKADAEEKAIMEIVENKIAE